MGLISSTDRRLRRPARAPPRRERLVRQQPAMPGLARGGARGVVQAAARTVHGARRAPTLEHGRAATSQRQYRFTSLRLVFERVVETGVEQGRSLSVLESLQRHVLECVFELSIVRIAYWKRTGDTEKETQIDAVGGRWRPCPGLPRTSASPRSRTATTSSSSLPRVKRLERYQRRCLSGSSRERERERERARPRSEVLSRLVSSVCREPAPPLWCLRVSFRTEQPSHSLSLLCSSAGLGQGREGLYRARRGLRRRRGRVASLQRTVSIHAGRAPFCDERLDWYRRELRAAPFGQPDFLAWINVQRRFAICNSVGV